VIAVSAIEFFLGWRSLRHRKDLRGLFAGHVVAMLLGFFFLIRSLFANWLGLSLGSLLGGTAVVEVIFGYQGIGNLAVTAITALDYPLIQGFVLWIALIYMVINLIVDISYEFLDPRIRRKAR